ncbi:hypothetical protein GCM10017655_26400 [Pseudomonas turukhanskensis]|uniref:Uncharacterized protein n=1 Tax=Pseudomonas turukhanskensis TaxID=1806536 RepID=A0A9W6NG18_9PSED|nr:hypothetical protein GCM10017655_26400 [Pseudomonas turukhanskensis]
MAGTGSRSWLLLTGNHGNGAAAKMITIDEPGFPFRGHAPNANNLVKHNRKNYRHSPNVRANFCARGSINT